MTNEIPTSEVQSITLAGQQFVILPVAEYRRLRRSVAEDAELPEFPAADARGYYPAAATMRTALARGIVGQRRELGLSQAELASLAKIRPETLDRIEKGQNTPGTATMQKIEQALSRAESRKKAGRSRRKQ